MKTSISILILISLLTLTGCSKYTASTTTQTSPSVDLNTPISYQIYCDSPMSAVKAESISIENDITFANVSQLDISYASMNNMINKNADQTKQLNLGKDAFQMQLKRSYSNSFSNSLKDDLHQYGYFDEYEINNETERIQASFRQNTDNLVFFLAFNRLNQPGDLTEQEARECANSLMTEIYGKSVLDEYHSVIVTTTKESTYMFTYSKMLMGYTTNDQIAIEVNRKGEVVSINARRWGIFDSIEAEITEKQITDAEVALRQSISETYEVQHKQLFVDAITGKCYLRLVVARTTDSGYQGNIFYINVN